MRSRYAGYVALTRLRLTPLSADAVARLRPARRRWQLEASATALSQQGGRPAGAWSACVRAWSLLFSALSRTESPRRPQAWLHPHHLPPPERLRCELSAAPLKFLLQVPRVC
jgi:lysylphosphatidylglycerol synthetase-like protein (DUF2156 family)